MSRHVLAVDLGTTGIKVAVVDAGGRVRSVASEVFPLIFVGDSGVEQDPHLWWDALGRCARKSIADSGLPGREVGLVAITSQYTSTTAVDRHGVPLANTVMWLDGRSGPYRRVPAPSSDYGFWIERHGLVAYPGDDVSHIDMIRALHPDVYEATHAFVEPMDALAARLTGVVSATQNTMFPMLTCDNRTWGLTEYSDELVAKSGIPVDKLPPLVPLGAPRGTVTADAAAHLGVAADATVTGATIDSLGSAVGTGAVSADRCGLVIGTSAVLCSHVPEKRGDIAHGLATAPSAIPHSWFLVAENGIGGKAFDVFVNQMVFADDGLGLESGDHRYDDVVRAAATVPAGSNGVLFMPFLIGSLAPRRSRHVRGGFLNIGLATTRAEMARAVLEGVAMNAAWLLPYFADLAGHPYDEITFGGGAARSPLWAQIMADATGVPVRRLAGAGCTTGHGAGLLALVEDGAFTLDDLPEVLVVEQVHEPDAAAHELLTRRRSTLIDAHDTVSELHARFDDPDRALS